MSNRDFIDRLFELEPGGVKAYTPLMRRLEKSANDIGQRRRIAETHLPIALLCALQDKGCLMDIKQVSDKYPELISIILEVALNLRKDKSFSEWTKYESNEYKNFVTELECKQTDSTN